MRIERKMDRINVIQVVLVRNLLFANDNNPILKHAQANRKSISPHS